MQLKMGRRTLLTPELQDKILGLVRRGNYTETVAKIVGINPDTIYFWLKRGSNENLPEEPYTTFYHKFWQAEAEAEAHVMGIVDAASAKEWQAAAWKLERRWSHHWASKDRNQVEVTGKDGGPVAVSMTDITEAMAAITKNQVEATEPNLERLNESVDPEPTD